MRPTTLNKRAPFFVTATLVRVRKSAAGFLLVRRKRVVTKHPTARFPLEIHAEWHAATRDALEESDAPRKINVCKHCVGSGDATFLATLRCD